MYENHVIKTTKIWEPDLWHLFYNYQGDEIIAGWQQPFSYQNENDQYMHSFLVIVLWYVFKFWTRKCSCKNKFYSWSKNTKKWIT